MSSPSPSPEQQLNQTAAPATAARQQPGAGGTTTSPAGATTTTTATNYKVQCWRCGQDLGTIATATTFDQSQLKTHTSETGHTSFRIEQI